MELVILSLNVYNVYEHFYYNFVDLDYILCYKWNNKDSVKLINKILTAMC